MTRETPTEAQVREALQRESSTTAAAKALGVSRKTAYRLIERYGIKVERRVA